MDPLHDRLGSVYHRIRQQYTVPEFVKKSNASEMFLTEIPKRCMADPHRGLYPCHTKAATWLSAAYFVDRFEEHSDVDRQQIADRLEKFAAWFGIQDSLQTLIDEKAQKLSKAAATRSIPDDFYALEIPQEDGAVKYAGAMTTPSDIQAAEKWLFENRPQLTFPQRNRIAHRILKRASVLGVAPSDRLQRVAGMGVNNSANIAQHLKMRSDLARRSNSVAAGALEKQASALRDHPADMSRDCCYRLAQALDEFDKHAHLEGPLLRGEIPYPEDVVYRHTLSEFQKAAEEHVSLPTGEVYALSDLTRLERQPFEDQFGTELAEALFLGIRMSAEKSASVLPTLPRPLSEMFCKYCSDQGIQPAMRERQAEALRIPDEYWAQYGRDA